MPKLIIVCGLPGSGKSTLAGALSRELNIARLHKDTIKETLYELQELSTLEDSKRVGNHSIRLLLKLAEVQVESGVDFIIEAPFNFRGDYEMLEDWIRKYGVSLITVVCTIPKEERFRRFISRPRHEAHHDAERLALDSFSDDPSPYDEIPGKKVVVVTDRPIDELVLEVMAAVGH